MIYFYLFIYFGFVSLRSSGQEINTESGVKETSKSSNGSQSGIVGVDCSTSAKEAAKELPSPATTEQENSGAEHSYLSGEDASPATRKNIDHYPSAVGEGSQVSSAEVNKVAQQETVEGLEKAKVDALDSNHRLSQSSDVHLNIRLPDGVSLQQKFSVTSTLQMVKDYVDRNQDGLGSYDLAIPYPRKVFGDEGMKTVSS